MVVREGGPSWIPGGDGGRFGCGSEFLQFHHAHGVREGREERIIWRVRLSRVKNLSWG